MDAPVTASGLPAEGIELCRWEEDGGYVPADPAHTPCQGWPRPDRREDRGESKPQPHDLEGERS